jgi:glucose/arabinose dehydrogenase
VISYGRENGGGLINGGKTVQPGMEQPVYYWNPSIAPSGMTFYDGKAFPAWKGSVFIGAMSGRQLVRLSMKAGKVVGEEKLLTDRCKRTKDVSQGPDGLIYVVTDEKPSEILRLVPAKK